MRAPKNLSDYTDAETAAKCLEDFARDLRANADAGDRVKWDLNVRMWNDAWLKPSKREVIVVGQGASSASVAGSHAHRSEDGSATAATDADSKDSR